MTTDLVGVDACEVQQIGVDVQTPLQQVKNLRREFGGLMAVFDVNFRVAAGEILAIIGPNGAGKTTMFNLISGVLPPTAGEICFAGRRLNGLKPHAVSGLGLTRTFQSVQLFGNMTTLENVMVGLHSRTRCGLLSAALCLPKARHEESAVRERAMEHLARVSLEGQASVSALSLPFGQQRLLEIARAMATEPKLLILNDPTRGIDVGTKQEIYRLIAKWAKQGYTILFTSSEIEEVLGVSHRILVMYKGKIVKEFAGKGAKKEKVMEYVLGGANVA